MMLLASVLIITVLTVAGVLAHQHQNPVAIKYDSVNSQVLPSKSPILSGQQSTTLTSAQQTSATLDITQWGVHVTLDSTTASLYYYINPDQPDIAYFSLRTISNIAPNCAADEISLGAVSRLTEAQQQDATSKPSALNQPGTLHIGNYWYSVGVSQAACTGNAAQQASISQGQPSYNPGELLKTLNTLAAD